MFLHILADSVIFLYWAFSLFNVLIPGSLAPRLKALALALLIVAFLNQLLFTVDAFITADRIMVPLLYFSRQVTTGIALWGNLVLLEYFTRGSTKLKKLLVILKVMLLGLWIFSTSPAVLLAIYWENMPSWVLLVGKINIDLEFRTNMEFGCLCGF